MRVAVIVNDISEVNIDATLMRDGGAGLFRTEEQGVDLEDPWPLIELENEEIAGWPLQ